MEASHNKNAGMNYPPQSTNSSIMKYALCLMKTHIEDNDLDDKVKLLLSVHDQQVSKCEKITQWASHKQRANGKAAMYVIPSGL
jgi:DNA polymerase I-like protein with 3'-5' exonuclease and polymerase domains